MDTSHQQNFKGESKKSTRRPDGGPYSCTTTTSGSKYAAKTLIEYDFDETLDIKEEIIEFPETMTVQTSNKTYASKLCTVHIREEDILEVKPKPQVIKKPKNQESEQEKKYICKECARTYCTLKSLKRHKKYVCGVMPQYSCTFCDKLFKRKDVMNSHVYRVHQKVSSKKSIAVYKCDKCSRSYSWLKNLMEHKRVDHAAVKEQFICDYCEYKSNWKSNIVKHIASRHLKAEKQFICDYCEYKSNRKGNLLSHIILRHLQAEKELICDYCQYKSNWKSNIVKHIASRHLKAKKQFVCDYCQYKSIWKCNLVKHIKTHSRHLQASKSKHKCDKCELSYNWLPGLARHKSLVHAPVKPQFICDYCGYNFYAKYRLVSHIKRHDI